MEDDVKIFINDPDKSPTLVYLPGIHGDASLVREFKKYVAGKLRFIEIEYGRNPDWEIQNYADRIEAALKRCGVDECYLLAESFGSQVMWAIMSKPRSFKVKGIILAGGFVRHPFISGVKIAKAVTKILSLRMIELYLRSYIWICKLLFRKEHRDKQVLNEFKRNRIDDADRRAIIKRYELIIKNDHRTVAKTVQAPVYFLAGRWDYIIVPRGPVLRWLRKNSPSFCDYKIIDGADHPVLANAPESSAKQILQWLGINY
ncbi:MAG: alpha/beta fold hydrolase [Verrucomicrobiia bacterium]